MRIELSDMTLFGNEVAEDEEDSVFLSYAVDRPEIRRFIADSQRIAIIRADKGQGKSALLKILRLRLQSQGQDVLLINTTAAALAPEIESVDSDKWVRGWKKKIFHQAACEIGAQISLAFGDDAISLVEEAEMNGFKSRSFVSTVADRMKSKSIPLEISRIGVKNPEQLLSRWSNGGCNVWFIIDDTDQNFSNTPSDCVKVSSLFTAVRQISNVIPEFKFRLAVRPYIWSIVKRKYEALSHNEQYISDLNWTVADFDVLLAKRVEGYLKRTRQWSEYSRGMGVDNRQERLKLIRLIFEDPMPWGRDSVRSPGLVLWSLSRHRPRWLVELCQKASEKAARNSHDKISYGDIEDELASFGRRRIEDTVAEYQVQCPKLEELLTAFAEEPERFSTEHLLRIIKNKVLDHVPLVIEGVLGAPSSIEVAHFLFKIGFLTARKDLNERDYEHFSYAEKPSLLSSRANLDQGHVWEIHPVFRQVLNLKNI